MPTSPRSIMILLSVESTERFKQLYRNRIGEGKKFKNNSRALADMIESIFLEYYNSGDELL